VDTEENVAELMTNHRWPLPCAWALSMRASFTSMTTIGMILPSMPAVYLQKLDGINAEGRDVGRLVLGTDTSKAYDSVH